MPMYHIDSNSHRVSYGTTIGILLLNTHFPMIPGDVGNASTYAFPVLFRVIPEMPTDFWAQADPFANAPAVIKEARWLADQGVAAITSDCGYMALYQQEVAKAVGVPVFLSSLLQVPFEYRTLPPGKKIGIIVADSRRMTPRILANAGVDDSVPYVVAGMEEQPAFWSAIIDETGSLDSEAIQKEAVSVATALVKSHPDVGIIHLECSNLPPYAAAIQEAVRLPVYDFNTMLQLVYSSFTRPRYVGTMY